MTYIGTISASGAHKRPTSAERSAMRQTGDALQAYDGRADRAESHRRGIGQKTDGGGFKRSKSQSGEHRGGNRHRLPNPEAPSMNAPKAKAITSACRYFSLVRCPMESLMISNCPVSTASRYSSIAVKTIQPMGNSPYAAP